MIYDGLMLEASKQRAIIYPEALLQVIENLFEQKICELIRKHLELLEIETLVQLSEYVEGQVKKQADDKDKKKQNRTDLN